MPSTCSIVEALATIPLHNKNGVHVSLVYYTYRRFEQHVVSHYKNYCESFLIIVPYEILLLIERLATKASASSLSLFPLVLIDVFVFASYDITVFTIAAMVKIGYSEVRNINVGYIMEGERQIGLGFRMA